MTEVEKYERIDFNNLTKEELLEYPKKLKKLKNKEKMKNDIKPVINKIMDLYSKYMSHHKRIMKVCGKILILFTIFIIVYGYLVDNEFSNLYLKCLFAYVGFILFIKIFNFLIGKWWIMKYDYEMTVKYITTRFPHLVKFFGPTGIGKDSVMVGVCRILANEMPKEIDERLKDLKKKLYMVDFNILDKYIDSNCVDYYNPSLFDKQMKFINDIKNNDFFFKFYNIDINDFMKDFDNWNKDIKGYKSEFVFNDDVNPTHYAKLIYDYIILKARKYSMNYVLSNQPLEESDGIMSKLFSYDFTRTYDDVVIKKNGSEKYEREVWWPWLEYCVCSETEVGLFYNNKNKESNSNIIADGVRNFKAANRHLVGEHTYFFSTDQVTNRENKSMRELIHAKCGIISRDIIPGGEKRIFFYKIFDFLKGLFVNKRHVDKYNKNLYFKKNTDLMRLQKLYEITKDDKYNDEIKKINSKEYINYTKHTLRYNHFVSKNIARIEKAKNDGYIYCCVGISDSDYMSSNMDIIPLRQLVENNIPLFNSNYKLRLCFKIKDCYGHYDTHFLKTSSEYRSKKSSINWLDIPTFNKDFKLTKENVKYIGYTSEFPMYGIDKEEVFNEKYHKM